MTKRVRTARQSIISRILEYPWHFALLGMVFMSRGYFINRGLFSPTQVLFYTLLTLVVTSIIFLSLRRLLLLHNAGFLTSLYVLIFFSYGHIYVWLNSFYSTQVIPQAMVVYLPHFTVFFLLLTFVIFRAQRRDFVQFTTFLNTVALTLIIGIVVREINYRPVESKTPPSPDILEFQNPQSTPDPLPDVYYIILDGYPGNDYLSSHWNIDNSQFIDQLTESGFYIADKSRSNYTYTNASLSSTLNMDYVQNLVPSEFTADALEPFIMDSRLARTLQSVGYEYIVITSGYLSYSSIADQTIDVDPNGSLLYLGSQPIIPDAHRNYREYLAETSMLRILDPNLVKQPGAILSWMGSGRIDPQIAALKEIPANEKPTFTLFHLTKPHTPVVFDENGEPFLWTDHYETEGEYWAHEEIHFEGQLNYVNQEIFSVIQHILNTSSQPPLIIIQGDHGIQLERERPDWGNWPVEILNAYYFPDQDYVHLYETITPVNSFRLILSQYFGLDYELLPEMSYYQASTAFTAHTRPLQFQMIPEDQNEPPFTPANQ